MLWNMFVLNLDSHSRYIIKQAEYHLWFKNRTVTNYFNLTEPQEGPTTWTGGVGWASAHRAPLEWYPWNEGVQYTCLRAGTLREMPLSSSVPRLSCICFKEQLKGFLTTKCISAHNKLVAEFECRREKTAHGIKGLISSYVSSLMLVCGPRTSELPRETIRSEGSRQKC